MMSSALTVDLPGVNCVVHGVIMVDLPRVDDVHVGVGGVAASRGEARDAHAAPDRGVEGEDDGLGLVDGHAVDELGREGELGAGVGGRIVVGLIDHWEKTPLPEDVLLPGVAADVSKLVERISQSLAVVLVTLGLVMATPGAVKTSEVELMAG